LWIIPLLAIAKPTIIAGWLDADVPRTVQPRWWINEFSLWFFMHFFPHREQLPNDDRGGL